MSGNGTDPIKAAVAKVATTRMQSGRIQLSSGRVVQIAFPADLSDVELLDLVGEIATAVRQAAVKARAGSRIIVPRA